MLGHLRRVIDREWIENGRSGSHTFVHRVLAIIPLLIVVPILSLPLAKALQTGLLIGGFCGTALVVIWIECRRMVGTGAVSSLRPADSEHPSDQGSSKARANPAL